MGYGTVPPLGIFLAKRKKCQPPKRLGPYLILALINFTNTLNYNVLV